jgi:hypothetical protein
MDQGGSFENVLQLHRLSLNGMKLSEPIGLGSVRIDVDSKNLKILQRDP